LFGLTVPLSVAELAVTDLAAPVVADGSAAAALAGTVPAATSARAIAFDQRPRSIIGW
jgi:hypothetical protein